ncbi:hypothetical protein ACMGD3_00745 [Lysinibacillus sphaericus]|uniref:hypothetical protein n=1 Tax=Lysinibacillus sphaericus TaxID=1421 RepID=UPI003F791AD9
MAAVHGQKRKIGKTFKKQYAGGYVEERSKESLVKIMQWKKMWIGTFEGYESKRH